jgi:hypothetical protein
VKGSRKADENDAIGFLTRDTAYEIKQTKKTTTTVDTAA